MSNVRKDLRLFQLAGALCYLTSSGSSENPFPPPLPLPTPAPPTRMVKSVKA